MATRPFAVVTLPARDTVLGGLSADGAHVELVAAAAQDDRFGSCWAIAFEVSGADAQRLGRARRQLASRHAVLAQDLLEGEHWRGAGWIPVQNVASRAFRLLWDPDMDTAPAWVVMESGIAQVRLRPISPGPAGEFVHAVARHLERRGIASDVREVPLDGAAYQRHLERLRWLDDDIVAPQALS